MKACSLVFKDSAAARIMDVLLDHWDKEISKTDLARLAGISRDSIYRILPDWEKLGLVKMTKKVGATKLLSLNTDNKAIRALKKFNSSIPERKQVKVGEVGEVEERLRLIRMKTVSMKKEEEKDEHLEQIKSLFERGVISRNTYEELLKATKAST